MNSTLKEGNEEGPAFDLPLENELLMLKLKAEFGAECTTGDETIPPGVVNEFLRSVYAFEKKFREPRKSIMIYDKIGRPPCRKAQELSDRQLSRELKRLLHIMRQHRLELDVLGAYPDRAIYSFVTDELFRKEIEDLDMPGFVNHFCYEDYHPNHEMDIRERTIEFLSQWFGKQLNEYSWQLADPFIHPDTRQFKKEEVLKKIWQVFDSYQCFLNSEYLISQLDFEWSDQRQNGNAYVAGRVRYDARLENGEVIHQEGPFELYLFNAGNWWSIFYFVFPGFNWNDQCK